MILDSRPDDVVFDQLNLEAGSFRNRRIARDRIATLENCCLLGTKDSEWKIKLFRP